MQKTVLIIGASHGGVTCAFALRKEGWTGKIVLLDADPELPYHRPPLSKTYLTDPEDADRKLLQTAESYGIADIDLRLGETVASINRRAKDVTLKTGEKITYDKLVLAVGARPLLPPLPGLSAHNNVFPMRSAADASDIRKALKDSENKQVVIIGGGYIGLETAASLHKAGAKVTVLERESRLLARVTTEVMSDFFQKLHSENGVDILTEKNVTAIENGQIKCADGSIYLADLVVVGVGIRVNVELAQAAGLNIENGIKVNAAAQTNDPDIYAVGDCTFHHNVHYDRFLRLESVQNAVDQAKVAAASICEKERVYDAIPWFWSDQYDVKLQIVGLSEGHTEAIVRTEADKENCFSVWYFSGEKLLAVDAVNNGKAFVLGTKFIKGGQRIDKAKLANADEPFKPANLLKVSDT